MNNTTGAPILVDPNDREDVALAAVEEAGKSPELVLAKFTYYDVALALADKGWTKESIAALLKESRAEDFDTALCPDDWSEVVEIRADYLAEEKGIKVVREDDEDDAAETER